jgi:hypothetical protein
MTAEAYQDGLACAAEEAMRLRCENDWAFLFQGNCQLMACKFRLDSETCGETHRVLRDCVGTLETCDDFAAYDNKGEGGAGGAGAYPCQDEYEAYSDACSLELITSLLSDECTLTHFFCHDESEQIDVDLHCDGAPDCSDESDEDTC